MNDGLSSGELTFCSVFAFIFWLLLIEVIPTAKVDPERPAATKRPFVRDGDNYDPASPLSPLNPLSPTFK